MPRAWLTLKAYDPESGVVLKFKTDRAAEVGRLMNGLGRLGRHMAALPQETEGRLMFIQPDLLATYEWIADAVMKEAPATEEAAPSAAAPTTAPMQPEAKAQQASTGGGGGGGGGKKKKKGKK